MWPILLILEIFCTFEDHEAGGLVEFPCFATYDHALTRLYLIFFFFQKYFFWSHTNVVQVFIFLLLLYWTWKYSLVFRSPDMSPATGRQQVLRRMTAFCSSSSTLSLPCSKTSTPKSEPLPQRWSFAVMVLMYCTHLAHIAGGRVVCLCLVPDFVLVSRVVVIHYCRNPLSLSSSSIILVAVVDVVFNFKKCISRRVSRYYHHVYSTPVAFFNVTVINCNYRSHANCCRDK